MLCCISPLKLFPFTLYIIVSKLSGWALKMRVRPYSFARVADYAVGTDFDTSTGIPAAITFSVISTGTLPDV